MKKRHATAVELLMSYPDSTVAETLGIRLKTLLRWMKMPEFVDALRERERDQRQTLARLARQAALRAAAALCEGDEKDKKPEAKMLLEALKISGAFETPGIDPADALAEIVNRAMNAEDDD